MNHNTAIDSILSPSVDIDSIEMWLKDIYTEDRKQYYDQLISETEIWIIETAKDFNKSMYDSALFIIDQINIAEKDYVEKQTQRSAVLVAHRNIERDQKELVKELNENAKKYAEKATD